MDDLPRTRAARFAISFNPQSIDGFDSSRGAWHETAEDIEEGIAWGEEKDRLLSWVRRQTDHRLTAVERHAVQQYFFEGLTYREAAARTGVNASTVHRAVRRAIRKLKEAAAEDDIRPKRTI